MRWFLFALVFLVSCASPKAEREVSLAPTAPVDRPIDAEMARIDQLIVPYVEKARASYPQAKARFLAGLPSGHSFFVTARIRDASGAVEQVFIAVDRIDGGTIYGRIWNEIQVVRGYRHGGRYQLKEDELLDWLITNPDGSEDGNFVGKFIDTLSEGSR